MGFFKKHYEKIIVCFLLIVFILLLCFQLLVMKTTETIDITSVLELKDPRPDYQKINFKLPAYNLESGMLAENSRWAQLKTFGRSSSARPEDLCTPPLLTRCPNGPHLIPVTDYPRPKGEKTFCSFCGKAIMPLRVDSIGTSEDSDGDGIPDKDEKRIGLNPNNAEDAKQDSDEDGFNNYEEYLAKTAINNPKSRPSYATKLFVKSVRSVKIPVILSGFGSSDNESKPESQWKINLQFPPKRANRSFALGKTFKAGKDQYKIVRIIKDFTTNPKRSSRTNTSKIVIHKVGTKLEIVLSIKKEVYDPRQHVVLYFEVDKKDIEVNVGEQFKVGDERRGEDILVLESADQKTVTAVVKTAQKRNVTLENIDKCQSYQNGGSGGMDSPFDEPPPEQQMPPSQRRAGYRKNR